MKRQKKLKTPRELEKNYSLRIDLSLFGILFLLASMIIRGFFIQQDIWLQILFTILCLFLLLIVYFVGLLPALTLDLTMFFTLILYLAYDYLHHKIEHPALLYWLFIPTLVCLLCYGVIQNIIKVQEQNKRLKEKLSHSAEIDANTELRTLEAYKDHFRIYGNNARDYGIPVYLIVIEIRYWDSLKHYLPKNARIDLIDTISDTLRTYDTGHELAYYIQNQPPTWAVLSSTDLVKEHGFQHFSDLKASIKEKVSGKLGMKDEFKDLEVQLMMSYTPLDINEHENAIQYLQDGISALQYDVN